MAEKESTNPLFSNPLETYPGLTVSDLNRYLPALQKADDIEMTIDNMHDGVYLSCLLYPFPSPRHLSPSRIPSSV